MSNIQELKKLLAENFGIHSDRELYEAMNGMEKLNIGVFAAPVRKGEKVNETTRSIA